MGLDGRIEELAPEVAGERRLLVGAGQTAVADDVGGQDRRDFSFLAHEAPRDQFRSSLSARAAPQAGSTLGDPGAEAVIQIKRPVLGAFGRYLPHLLSSERAAASPLTPTSSMTEAPSLSEPFKAQVPSL